MGKNAPSRPNLDPQGHKTYFFGMSGYENPLIKKRIFDLSAIGRELVRPYRRHGRHVEFSKFPGEILFGDPSSIG